MDLQLLKVITISMILFRVGVREAPNPEWYLIILATITTCPRPHLKRFLIL
jgi:hypothetical protein